MKRVRAYLEGLLTSGQFEYRILRGMFLTLVLDQFFIYFISMLSTAMVSSVGESALAAVGLVGTINGMVSLLFTSLATGGAIVVARAKGRGDDREIRRVIGEVAGLCGAVAAVLCLLMNIGADFIVNLIYPHVEAELKIYAAQYMRLIGISFIPYSVFCAIFNIFRCLGDTRSSLLMTVVINVAHLLLSVLFINVLQWGVRGSGLSYIVARMIGMTMALIWVLKVNNHYGVRLRHFFHFRPEITKEIISLGMPLTVENMLMQGGMLVVQVYLAGLGKTALAANVVANSILNLYHSTSGTMSTLDSTVCGQCFGAGRMDLVKSYTRNLIKVGCLVLLATSLILYPLTPLLLKIHKAEENCRDIVYTTLAIGAVGMPLLWCHAYLPAMTMRVAGDSVAMGIVSVVSLALGRCAIGYLLAIPLGLGVPGMWLGMAAEWLIRTVALRVRFRSGKWENKASHPAADE